MRWLAGGLCALVLLACGGADGADEVDAGAVTTPTTTFVRLDWPIEDIARTGDPLSLDVRVEGLPVEGAGPPCAVTVTGSSDIPTTQVHVSVETDGSEFDPSFPGCELGERVVRIPLMSALRSDASVSIANPEHRLWVSAADGSFTRCELPGCDPATGKPPEPPGCDRALIDDATAIDVPKGSDVEVQACEVPWAIVDIDLGSGACPPSEGEENPCAGERIDRYYFHLVAGHWERVMFDQGPGCGAVPEELPEFPTRLCEALGPARSP